MDPLLLALRDRSGEKLDSQRICLRSEHPSLCQWAEDGEEIAIVLRREDFGGSEERRLTR